MITQSLLRTGEPIAFLWAVCDSIGMTIAYLTIMVLVLLWCSRPQDKDVARKIDAYIASTQSAYRRDV